MAQLRDETESRETLEQMLTEGKLPNFLRQSATRR